MSSVKFWPFCSGGPLRWSTPDMYPPDCVILMVADAMALNKCHDIYNPHANSTLTRKLHVSYYTTCILHSVINSLSPSGEAICHVTSRNLVNIGSANGLVSDGTKPLTEPMLSKEVRRLLTHKFLCYCRVHHLMSVMFNAVNESTSIFCLL